MSKQLPTLAMPSAYACNRRRRALPALQRERSPPARGAPGATPDIDTRAGRLKRGTILLRNVYASHALTVPSAWLTSRSGEISSRLSRVVRATAPDPPTGPAQAGRTFAMSITYRVLAIECFCPTCTDITTPETMSALPLIDNPVSDTVRPATIESRHLFSSSCFAKSLNHHLSGTPFLLAPMRLERVECVARLTRR